MYFHDREDKPMWWKLFDRQGQHFDELYYDIECIAGAKPTGDEIITKTTSRSKSPTHTVTYQIDPDQEFKVPRSFGSKATFKVLEYPDGPDVKMQSFNVETGEFKIDTKIIFEGPISLIPFNYIKKDKIIWSMISVIGAYLDNPEEPSAIMDFLRRRGARTLNHEPAVINESSPEERLARTIEVAENLDHSLLVIQGPPGAGKTYTATHIIIALLQKGYSVGITSNSHKAVINVLREVATQAPDQFPLFHCSSADKIEMEALGVGFLENKEVLAMPGTAIGTTAWGICNGSEEKFDYLFVDEAGQVSIANLIAMSNVTNNLIILGDQMQLGQPIQGSHPGEVGQSVLAYYLQAHQTIPQSLGVFLGTTFRMHPDVNDFVSKAFYENRLQAAPHCSAQRIEFNSPHPELIKGTGIVHIQVPHIGNTQASEEEAKKIAELRDYLLGQTFIDKHGQRQLLTLNDILFIAPYNHQVNVLKYTLGFEARVGSVDLFQGQEAPVVILSMCASQADETARGLAFLLNPNRMNVAISRAKALAIVVSSDGFLDIDFNCIQALKLANNFEMMKLFAKGELN
jgi:uncharacterized protein